MASQSGFNRKVAFKVQSALGTAASGSGGTGLHVRPGNLFNRNVTMAESGLVRGDGMSSRPRHGSTNVTGSIDSELMLTAHDLLLRAALRSAAETGTFTITESDVTSVTISGTGTTITAGSGSFLTEGVRAGMWGKFADLSVAGNNAVWFPIVGVTASVLTVPSGFLADNTSDTDFDLVIAKSVTQTDPPTERYYTFDDYFGDVDYSSLIVDAKIGGLRFSAQPDQPVIIGYDIMGRTQSLASTGSSPTLTDPTFYDSPSLYLADGTILVNGTAVANVTGIDFNLAMNAGTLPIIGSRTSPDVFLQNARLTGNLSCSVENDTFLNYAINETQLSVILHCKERETSPADFIAFYLPNLTVANWNTPIGGSAGAIQTMSFVGGKDNRGTGYNASMLTISSSSADL